MGTMEISRDREESRQAYRQLLDELAIQQRELSRGVSWNWNIRMAAAKAGLGRIDEALEHLKVAEPQLHSPSARDDYLERVAEVAVLSGRPEAAFSALSELIIRGRRFTPALLRVEPFYESLYRDPRFEALLEPIQPGTP